MAGESMVRERMVRGLIFPLLGLACVCIVFYGAGKHAATLQNPTWARGAWIFEDLKFDEDEQAASLATRRIATTRLMPTTGSNATVAALPPQAVCTGDSAGFSCAEHEGRKICVNKATYIAGTSLYACASNMPSGDLAVGLCPAGKAVPYNFKACPFWKPMNKYEPYATFAKGMPVPHAGLKPGAYVAWVVRKDPATPKRPDWFLLQGSAKPLGGLQAPFTVLCPDGTMSCEAKPDNGGGGGGNGGDKFACPMNANGTICSSPNGVCISSSGKCKCKPGFIGIDCSHDVSALPPLAREVFKWNKPPSSYQEWVEKQIKKHGPFGASEQATVPFAKDVSWWGKSEENKEHEVGRYDKIMSMHKKLGTPLYSPLPPPPPARR